MIVQGLIIVLVILIVSNFALGFINQVSPPCQDAEEFFRNARMLPDGSSASLGSIPTSLDHYYIGARVVPTGIPGVIGLTSHNSYLGNTTQENYTNPAAHEMAEDESDCARNQKNEKELSNTAVSAINSLFPMKKNKEVVTDQVVKFNEYEGIEARPLLGSKSLKGNHMDLSYKTMRDGYSDRRSQNDSGDL